VAWRRKFEYIFTGGESQSSANYLYDALAVILFFHLKDALAVKSLGFTVGSQIPLRLLGFLPCVFCMQ
jgi:hypothetical protein